MKINGIGSEIIKIDRLKKRELQIAKKYLMSKEYEIYLKKINHLAFLASLIALKGACYKALKDPKKDLSKIEIIFRDGNYYYEDTFNYVYLTCSSEKEYCIAYATSVSKID